MVPKHITSLDGLRGIAILTVMLFHSVQHFPPLGDGRHYFWTIEMYGWAGVDLFFVLSGFLITGILWDSKDSENYFSVFYARRMLRISPLYYLAVTIAVIGVVIFGSHGAGDTETLKRQAWAWLYGINFLSSVGSWPFVGTWFNLSGFWSLAVEEHFYLLWPFIVRRLNRVGIMWACIVIMTSALLLRIALFIYAPNNWLALYVLTPTRMDSLAAGAFVALALRGPSRNKVVSVAPIILAGSTLIVAIGILITKTTAPSGKFNSIPGHTILAICFAALIVVLISLPEKSWFRNAFEMKWLRSFGKYSYGLYVYQAFLMVWLDKHLTILGLKSILHVEMLAFIVRSLICIACLFVVAFVSWHLYEKQWLRMKSYFRYHVNTIA